jgi:CYTH domain-containing protein
MGIEIERKFLIRDDLWRRHSKVVQHQHQHQRQGYLNCSLERRVRVRVAGLDR